MRGFSLLGLPLELEQGETERGRPRDAEALRASVSHRLRVPLAVPPLIGSAATPKPVPRLQTRYRASLFAERVETEERPNQRAPINVLGTTFLAGGTKDREVRIVARFAVRGAPPGGTADIGFGVADAGRI